MRIAAAIQLGLIIETHWKFHSEEQARRITVPGFEFIIVPAADKEQVRANILGKMFECTIAVINKQYTRCLMTLSRYDYPEQWPTIVPLVQQALSSGNDLAIMTGLQALFALVKKYEYEMDSDRVPLFDLMTTMLPLMGSLVEAYMNQTSESALRILHLVCKCFYIANQLYMLPVLKEEGQLMPWMQFFKFVLDQQLPDHLCSHVEEMEKIAARDKTIEWKLRGIISKLTYRVFSKYGNPKF